MKTYAKSHIGRIRKRNEDRYLIREPDNNSVFLVVSDGMGGEVAGDYAASITVNILNDFWEDAEDKERLLSQLVREADLAVRNEIARDPRLEGMGSTVTAVLIRNGFAYRVHVGDSRLYLFRNRELIPITRDQNMAQFLIEEGEITEEAARTHFSRYMLDQCVGQGDCEPETGTFELMRHDIVILTTDGLHDELSHQVMTSILNTYPDVQPKADALVQAAFDAGGRDNITIVVAEVD